jgi:hypothetical protein
MPTKEILHNKNISVHKVFYKVKPLFFRAIMIVWCHDVKLFPNFYYLSLAAFLLSLPFLVFCFDSTGV